MSPNGVEMIIFSNKIIKFDHRLEALPVIRSFSCTMRSRNLNKTFF